MFSIKIQQKQCFICTCYQKVDANTENTIKKKIGKN